MSQFKQKVIKIVSMVPYGKVASYGQVALLAGLPRAARAVGQVLKSLEEDILTSTPDVPWWRIVNNSGRISIKGTKYHDALMQRKLLQEESINIKEDFTFEIEKYRWRPTLGEVSELELSDSLIEKLIQKYQL